MSNTDGISPCCLSGNLHSGTPTGKVEKFAGLDTYVSGEGSSVIVCITDIFGYDLNNVRLAADEYAKIGNFKVLVPDFFKGDSVPISHLKNLTPALSDPPKPQEEADAARGESFKIVGPWLQRQGDDVVRPLMEKVLADLKADSSVKKIGIIGFCWGGRQVLHLGASDAKTTVDAIVANHPSFAEFPAAFEGVSVPTLVQAPADDGMFPPEQVAEVKDKIFAGKKGCSVIIYQNAAHGFTIRGDQNNEEEKKQKDDATVAAVNFLRSQGL